MSCGGSSMSQWKPRPPLTHCYQTIRARPLLRTPEKTSAVSLRSDTSASHTLPPQQAREPGGQKQHAKDWNCSHCEFQSVTSVVCFPRQLGVWYSFEVRLAPAKENWGVWEQLAAGGGVKDEGRGVWGRHSGRRVMGSYCSLPEIIVSGPSRTDHILTCDKYNNKLEQFHVRCWQLTGSDDNTEHLWKHWRPKYICWMIMPWLQWPWVNIAHQYLHSFICSSDGCSDVFWQHL